MPRSHSSAIPLNEVEDKPMSNGDGELTLSEVRRVIQKADEAAKNSDLPTMERVAWFNLTTSALAVSICIQRRELEEQD